MRILGSVTDIWFEF